MYPIALFAYKRPGLTCKTLDSLRTNPEFEASPVFIYCDGPKSAAEESIVEATRKAIRSYKLTNAVFVERDRNIGLANSIISGVTELCGQFGAVIVVEDDLLVSRSFLSYMNSSLSRYQDVPTVMAIAGHTFVDCEKVPSAKIKTDAVLLPFANSWGWATWRRAWQHFDATVSGLSALEVDRSLRRRFDLDGSYPFYQMLRKAASGRIDSWAIRWYMSIFMNDGLVLYPARTLVQHIGHDGTGTHVTRFSRTRALEMPNDFAVVNFPSEIAVDPTILAAAKARMRSMRPSNVLSLLRMALSG